MVEPAPMTSARDEILERVRAALAGSKPAEPVQRYYRRGGESGGAVVDLFCERLEDYRAEVQRVGEGALPAAIAAVCAARTAVRIGVPPGLSDAWRPADAEVVEDHGLTPYELDALDGVVTGCALGIAETGTIVLDGAEASGRRALTLVPDLHVCVVREEQIVASVPDAVDRLAEAARAGRPITLVSGPSATSDIELDRVEGVHGPRRLEVLVVAPAPRA
jgi:L-lactate dehydrogenase complex protein LldG